MPAKRTTKKSVVKKRGRPSKFSPELTAEICARLGRGEPLAVICRDDHMPTDTNVRGWMAKDPEFLNAIADARANGFDAIAQECLDIADNTSHDDEFTESGGLKPNSEWISRSRLRVETRLKLLAKWDPKRYGDRQTLDVKSDGLDNFFKSITTKSGLHNDT